MKCFAQRSKTRSSWIFSPVRLKSTSCVCTRNFEPKGWLQSSSGGKTTWDLSNQLGSSRWGLLVWPPFTSLGHIKSWIADNYNCILLFPTGRLQEESTWRAYSRWGNLHPNLIANFENIVSLTTHWLSLCHLRLCTLLVWFCPSLWAPVGNPSANLFQQFFFWRPWARFWT